MELESWGRPARGLREYFRQVAELCGSGEAFSVQLETPLSGYIPLEERVAAFPELDVALVWEERTGWAAVLETATNELVVLSYLASSVFPTPEEVAEFAANPGAGSASPAAPAGEDILALLSDYAVSSLRPLAG
jgi:hypothetical protein